MVKIVNLTSIRKASSLATIYLSKSNCIYENLAFEEWLFRNHNFEKFGDAMLLWRNQPAVVIGRHQNPWMEANFWFCEQNGINIARRHSGGGTVYHDLGNLNISILTPQERHIRKKNLQLISDYLNKSLGVSCLPNERDDICLQGGNKISGTAARIGRHRAYHHFTLLVDSVPAKHVGYLAQKVESVKIEDVIQIVSLAFKSQFSTCRVIDWHFDRDRYVGLFENYEQWIFGKTPKFELRVLGANPQTANSVHADHDLAFKIIVETGIIKKSKHNEFKEGQPFQDSYIASGLYKF